MGVESDSEALVSFFMAALVVLVGYAEDKKSTPHTKDEVYSIRDNAACVMMEGDDARKMDDGRDYCDIVPENCWHEWQMARRDMDRKPESAHKANPLT